MKNNDDIELPDFDDSEDGEELTMEDIEEMMRAQDESENT